MTRDLPELLAEQVALGLLDLTAEVVRRHLVGLVADDEVEVALPAGGLELGLQLLVAREVVEARHQQVLLEEGVAGVGGVDHLARHDLEAEVELLTHLVLPLVDQHARADDEHAPRVAADHELLDEQAGHDGLAGAGIVGEQEVQRLAREHLLVHRRDLVRQRQDVGGAHRKQRIEEVGELDATRLAHEAEERAVGAERPGAAGRLDPEARLVVAVQQLTAGAPGLVAVRERERRAAVPLHRDHGHCLAGHHPGGARSGREVLKTRH